MDRGAWWAAVHGVAKSWTRLSDFTFTFQFSCIGEGNGNPLQCSCLESPRDGGARWAAVYGVTQSRTRMAENEEKPNNLLMRVKEQNEKAGLKLNIQKTKMMACGPIAS